MGQKIGDLTLGPLVKPCCRQSEMLPRRCAPLLPLAGAPAGIVGERTFRAVGMRMAHERRTRLPTPPGKRKRTGNATRGEGTSQRSPGHAPPRSSVCSLEAPRPLAAEYSLWGKRLQKVNDLVLQNWTNGVLRTRQQVEHIRIRPHACTQPVSVFLPGWSAK